MRIHLASTRPPIRVDIAKMVGIPYSLFSYFYAAKQELSGPLSRKPADADRYDEFTIVDSGVFSYMFGSEQGTIPATYEAYRDYTRRYLDTLDAWGFPGIVVEVDAQRLIGSDATWRLREEFAPIKDRVMHVWHYPDGMDGLETMARKYTYLGLGLPEIRKVMMANGRRGQTRPAVMNLLKRVHKACGDKPPRVHLLGCTEMPLMETDLAWSCDSTSWMSGNRYGNGYTFDSIEGLVVEHIDSPAFKAWVARCKDEHPKTRRFIEEHACDYPPAYNYIVMACAAAFSAYQNWLDSRYVHVPCRGDDLACEELSA